MLDRVVLDLGFTLALLPFEVEERDTVVRLWLVRLRFTLDLLEERLVVDDDLLLMPLCAFLDELLERVTDDRGLELLDF